jgi:uncharacterized phage protein (TIGR02218 family)
MKAASGTLITLLNGNNAFLMADLFTFTMWDGTVYRWTDADLSIVFGGNTFATASEQGATVPIIERGTTRCVVGLEVDTLDITLKCGQTVLMGGIPLVQAACNGIFDGCRVLLERVFMPTWGDTTPGSVVLFEGNVSGCEPSSTSVHLTIKSELERLNVALPKYLYQPACGHVLYGAGCGIDKSAWTVTGIVSAGATTTSVPSDRGEAAGYFNLGVMRFTSGACLGARRSVRSFTGGVVVPALPLPSSPATGDTFVIYPGCDHTMGAAGCARFANLNRYRGFPWIPRPETAR